MSDVVKIYRTPKGTLVNQLSDGTFATRDGRSVTTPPDILSSGWTDVTQQIASTPYAGLSVDQKREKAAADMKAQIHANKEQAYSEWGFGLPKTIAEVLGGVSGALASHAANGFEPINEPMTYSRIAAIPLSIGAGALEAFGPTALMKRIPGVARFTRVEKVPTAAAPPEVRSINASLQGDKDIAAQNIRMLDREIREIDRTNGSILEGAWLTKEKEAAEEAYKQALIMEQKFQARNADVFRNGMVPGAFPRGVGFQAGTRAVELPLSLTGVEADTSSASIFPLRLRQ